MHFCACMIPIIVKEMVDMIDSVKIVHAWNQVKEYRFWADFFRCVGMHVCDCTSQNNDFSNDFSMVIVLKKSPSEADGGNVNQEDTDRVVFDSKTEIESLNNAGEKAQKYFDECMKKIQKVFEAREQLEDFEDLKIIGTIYLKHHISYYRNIYSYFKENDVWVQEAQDEFVNAYVDLSTAKAEKEKTIYTLYTFANLTRYINETCVFLNQKLLLSTEQCVNYLESALQKEPKFYNARLLEAIIYELDKEYYLKSGELYESALKEMDQKKYTSYPYYLYGRYCERKMKNLDKAKQYYEKSFEINEMEYRAIYKLAIIAKREGDYEGSIKWFEKICTILSKKEDGNYLQPKEYEYLFKAYFGIGRIYGDVFCNLKEYDNIVKKMDALHDKLCSDKKNQAYVEIFGEEEKRFREATFLRIQTVQLQCK